MREISLVIQLVTLWYEDKQIDVERLTQPWAITEKVQSSLEMNDKLNAMSYPTKSPTAKPAPNAQA
jgi:hypothetical protein